MNVYNFFKDILLEAYSIAKTLFKLMIPVIIIVKVLQELGVIAILGKVLAPIMSIVGLPETMGLVWGTAIFTSLYGGMLILVTTLATEPLTVAQISVISGMMLIAHGLPIEVRIAQRAGMGICFSLLLRIVGGFFFGWCLHSYYTATGSLQEYKPLLWQPQAADDSIFSWLVLQLEGFGFIILIIISLVFLLRILKIIGVEKLLKMVLKPVLKILGIGESAITLTIVGITLGLTYGGGLLIREAEKGTVGKRDVFVSIALLSLFHSLIEDTILVMMMGADISAALWFRMAFSFVVIAILSRVVGRMEDGVFTRYCGASRA